MDLLMRPTLSFELHAILKLGFIGCELLIGTLGIVFLLKSCVFHNVWLGLDSTLTTFYNSY